MGNSWIFSNDHVQDNLPPEDDQSAVACLAAQRAAHKNAAASESQPAAQEPEPTTQEPKPTAQGPEPTTQEPEREVHESDSESVGKEPE